MLAYEQHCETCGKLFYPYPVHVYKRVNKKGITVYFHTYSCMVAWDKKNPKACVVKWGDK